MTKEERAGLEILKDLGRHIVLGKNITWPTALVPTRNRDLIAAVKWIAHQQAIDERRRRPRSKYRRR